MNEKTEKSRKPRKTKAVASKANFYVMYGFKKSNKDKLAYLQIRKDGSTGKHGIYKIVREEADATRFPDKPLNEASAKGFGTPLQWARFFNEEKDLSEWCFHPISVKQ